VSHAPTGHQERARLRRFGLTVAAGFAIIGAVSRWRGHETPPAVLWTLAAALLAPAVIAPTILGPVERGWLVLGSWLGWVNTRVILTVLFYVAVTPIALVMRRFRDPLDRRLHETKPSYWIRRPSTPLNPKAYQQQF
jgi:hypothetical protein